MAVETKMQANAIAGASMTVNKAKAPSNLPTFTIGDSYKGCIDLHDDKRIAIIFFPEFECSIRFDETGKPFDESLRKAFSDKEISKNARALISAMAPHVQTAMNHEIVKKWEHERKQSALPPQLS